MEAPKYCATQFGLFGRQFLASDVFTLNRRSLPEILDEKYLFNWNIILNVIPDVCSD
jgi:hypothetical protein